MKKYIYSSLKLPASLNNYRNTKRELLNCLDNLSLINIFVGSNNSGKSRFMREITKLTNKDIYFHTNNPDTKKFIEDLIFINNGLFELINKDYSASINSFYVYSRQNNPINRDSFKKLDLEFYNFNDHGEEFINTLKILNSEGKYQVNSSSGAIDMNKFEIEVRNFFKINQDRINNLFSFAISPIDFYRLYIPILRSLNDFRQSAIGINGVDQANNIQFNDDFYENRTSSIYGFNTDDHLQLFTGQRLYKKVREMLLGEKEERHKIAEYEAFLSKNFFNNKEVTIVPKEKDDVINVRIGADEKSVYNLGDGIQSIIMLTFPLFMVDNGLFFIEEPEIHLHPGLQRKFLELLLNSQNNELKNKNHQYFMTTHSNHFLDLTFDYSNISIYKFHSIDVDNPAQIKIVEPVSIGDRTILQELGVKNSSLFLTNATIWVEGITDRLYLRKFLELYQNHNTDLDKIFEDSDYSFVEYGGNNLVHWSFLDSGKPTICTERLCAVSFLITDKDGKNKQERQKRLKAKLGNRYKCLTCREIENLLSLETIERVVKSYASDSGFILPKFREKYPHLQEKIGNFIDRKLKPKNKYAGKSGSIAPTKKLGFCERAVDGMTYEEMMPLAKTLAKTIYDFVVEQKNK